MLGSLQERDQKIAKLRDEVAYFEKEYEKSNNLRK
jgi:hypothetical protein